MTFSIRASLYLPLPHQQLKGLRASRRVMFRTDSRAVAITYWSRPKNHSIEGENMKLERLLLILGGGSPLWLFVFGVVYVCIRG